MNLTRQLRRHLQTAAMRTCLACAAVFLFCARADATYIMFAFTNQVGQPDTNRFTIRQVSGPTANADGSFTTIGLPIPITPATNGQATNFIMQGNWFATNTVLGKGIYFGNFPQDSGPTVYRMWDYQISGANLFITRIVGNSNSITAGAVTNAIGYVPVSPAQLVDQGAANTNDTIARVLAQGTANTNDAAARVLTQGTANTNDTIARVRTQGTANTNDTIARVLVQGTANTNDAAARVLVQGTANTNDAVARVLVQGTANTNDTIARVLAQGTANTNDAAARVLTQGTANTNDTISRVRTQGTANTNDTIARVLSQGTANTNDAAARVLVQGTANTNDAAARITTALGIVTNINIVNLTTTTQMVTFAQTNASASNIFGAALTLVTNIVQSVSGTGNAVMASMTGKGTNTTLVGSPSIVVTNLSIPGNNTGAINLIQADNGSGSFGALINLPHGWQIQGGASEFGSSFKASGVSIGSNSPAPYGEIGSVVLGTTNDIGGNLGGSNPSTYGTILGGTQNKTDVRVDFPTIIGGYNNLVSASYCYALGVQANPQHRGSWVYNVPDNGTLATTGTNQFLLGLRGGGVGINTNTLNGRALSVSGNAGFSGVTVEQSMNIGVNPFLAIGTNTVGMTNNGNIAINGTSANGTYFYNGTYLTNQQGNGFAIGWSSPNFLFLSNGVTLQTGTSLNQSAWSVVSGAAGAAGTYVGSTWNMNGVVMNGYVSSSNLTYQMTLAAKTTTNNLGALAFQGNNTTVSNAQASVTATTATNFNGSSITNRFNGGFIFTNPASKTSLTMQSNAVWIGTDGYDANSQGVPNNDFNEYYFSRSGSFYVKAGQNAGSGTEASFQLSDGYQPILENPQTAFFRVKLDADTAEMDYDSAGANAGAVFTIHSYFAPKFLLNEYDPNGDYSPSDVLFGVNGAEGLHGGVNNQYGRSLHIFSEGNVHGGAGGNIFIGGGFGDTGQANGSVIITNGSFIGAMNGNGIGLTNVYWAITNGGLRTTNYGNYVATNTGGSLSNFVISTVAGTTNLTRFNANTNLLIAGVSQEQMFTGKIVLRATNGVPWSLVYYRTGIYWTNAGSGYGVITNGNGATPQWNLKDASGNTLSFKSANSSPQGQWTPNFIATNAPIGDWGRISDFGSGGNAEAWTITNISFNALFGGYESSSAVIYTNAKTFELVATSVRISDNDTADGESYLSITGNGNGLSLMDGANANSIGLGNGIGSDIQIASGSAVIRLNDDGNHDGPFILLSGTTTNTGDLNVDGIINVTTNTAPVFDVTNDLIIGKVNVGPAQRFSVSLSAYTNATLSAAARGDLVYSNFDTGTITKYSFSIPAGVLATDTQTNELCIPDATPNSRFWLTNCFAVPGTTRITRK